MSDDALTKAVESSVPYFKDVAGFKIRVSSDVPEGVTLIVNNDLAILGAINHG